MEKHQSSRQSLPRASPSRWQGILDYGDALSQMECARSDLIRNPEKSGVLLLCEHPPVITCGKHSRRENILLSSIERRERGIGLQHIERGGDVTYHGPGQLMIYPVLRVGIRVQAFLSDLAGGLSELATSYDAFGSAWKRERAGLWIGKRKLAACGLHLRRGICIHGFAFNVCTPSKDWKCIVPCGLSGPPPISLHEAMNLNKSTKPRPSVQECAARAAQILAHCLAAYGLDLNDSCELGSTP